MAKSPITRTFNPIHFEDLDPKRFEDLVRELIYDFRDWQTIEATGRGGSDEGFDARAYEKVNTSDVAERNDSDDSDESIIETHPMDGNLWMIQCKREKEIGPKRLLQIIEETITPASTPYGFVLVAPVNFTKKSYDTFRTELKRLGVMEFYLWGKAELEDMLHMPKFDRVLFTFFGISLVAKKRSRVVELRSTIGIKSKLIRLFPLERPVQREEVFVRDINDNFYPEESSYSDFNVFPRWGRYYLTGYTIDGIVVEISKHYGYYDSKKKEWDIDESWDLNDIFEEGETFEEGQRKMETNKIHHDFCLQFPKAKQVEISKCAVIKFEDISLIDDKGDPLNPMVHIYADFRYQFGPFHRMAHSAIVCRREIIFEKQACFRIRKFPSVISALDLKTSHTDRFIEFDPDEFKMVSTRSQTHALFDKNGEYSFLNPQDTITIRKKGNENEKVLARINCKYTISLKEYREENCDNHVIGLVRAQLGQDISDDTTINVYEYNVV